MKAWTVVPALVLGLEAAASAQSHDADSPSMSGTDIDSIANAAEQAAAGATSTSTRASMLLNLADALVKAGKLAHARIVLVNAAALLDQSNDLVTTSVRGSIVEKLAQFGAIAEAEKMAAAAIDAQSRIVLLGKMGAGLAKAGNLAAAQNTALSLKSEAEKAVSDPQVAAASAGAISEIALALAANGGSESASLLADALPPSVATQVRAKLDQPASQQQFVQRPGLRENAGAEEYLEAAKLSAKQDDRSTARALAIKASTLAAADAPARGEPGGKWYDHLALLGRIFGVLNELGAYDEAIATIQANDPINRKQFYLRVVRAEIEAHDRSALARTLPITLNALKMPTPGVDQSPQFLFELTKTLAVAGYQNQARTAYDELIGLISTSAPGGRPTLAEWKLAELKADMGDLPGALDAANKAGPMTAPPGPAQLAFMTAVQFDGATKPPTTNEISEATKRAKELLPARMAGPKANALSAIAIDLAAQGKSRRHCKSRGN